MSNRCSGGHAGGGLTTVRSGPGAVRWVRKEEPMFASLDSGQPPGGGPGADRQPPRRQEVSRMKVLMLRWLLGRRALAAGLLAVALTASAVTVEAAPALATQANPSTNDQSTTVNTAWWAYNGVTASQVGSLLTTNSARLTQIRVENPAVPTFDVTMVSNSGVYASGWWWYYGLTGSQVSSTLTTNNARLISLEP